RILRLDDNLLLLDFSKGAGYRDGRPRILFFSRFALLAAPWYRQSRTASRDPAARVSASRVSARGIGPRVTNLRHGVRAEQRQNEPDAITAPHRLLPLPQS